MKSQIFIYTLILVLLHTQLSMQYLTKNVTYTPENVQNIGRFKWVNYFIFIQSGNVMIVLLSITIIFLKPDEDILQGVNKLDYLVKVSNFQVYRDPELQQSNNTKINKSLYERNDSLNRSSLKSEDFPCLETMEEVEQREQEESLVDLQ